MLQNLRELYRYGELLKNMTVKELRVRYKESALGFFWSLFTPILNMAVYTLVFSLVLKIGLPHYPVFLLAGIFPWQFFQTSIATGCVSIVHNGNLVKKVYFPLEILPLSIVLANFVNFLLSLLVYFGLVLVSGVGIHLSILALPLILLVQMALTTGLTLLVAVYTVYFRDIEHFLGVLLFALFYGTPIIFTLSQIGQYARQYAFLFELNPLTPIITAYQDVLYFGRFPDWGAFGLTALVAIAVLVLGYHVFNKHKGFLPEEV